MLYGATLYSSPASLFKISNTTHTPAISPTNTNPKVVANPAHQTYPRRSQRCPYCNFLLANRDRLGNHPINAIAASTGAQNRSYEQKHRRREQNPKLRARRAAPVRNERRHDRPLRRRIRFRVLNRQPAHQRVDLLCNRLLQWREPNGDAADFLSHRDAVGFECSRAPTISLGALAFFFAGALVLWQRKRYHSIR